MANMSTAFATIVLQGVFGDDKGTNAPTTLYVGLSSTTPTYGTGAFTNITEPTTGGYARVAVTNTDTNWTITDRVAENATDIEFPTATASWGDALTHAVLFSASTAGDAYFVGALGSSVTVGEDVRVVLDAAAVTFTVPE